MSLKIVDRGMSCPNNGESTSGINFPFWNAQENIEHYVLFSIYFCAS
jgi:hypothetical protein